jgi:hypothetical protein
MGASRGGDKPTTEPPHPRLKKKSKLKNRGNEPNITTTEEIYF